MIDSFSAVNFNTGYNVTSLPVTPPANDDSKTLVAVYGWNDPGGVFDPVISTPSGWSELRTVQTNVDHANLKAFVKQGDGSTVPVQVSFTVAGSPQAVDVIGIIGICNGVDALAPISASTTGQNTSGLTHTLSQITTAYPESVVVGIWVSNIDGLTYTPPSGMTARVNYVGGPPGVFLQKNDVTYALSILIADAIQVSAGASGGKAATVQSSASGVGILFALQPSLAPSAPVITSPVANDTITTGRTVAVSYQPSTDPDTAQGLISYEGDYSLNGPNGPWADITSPRTANGAVTFNFNTTGLGLTTNLYIRVRSYDGARNGPWAVVGPLTIAQDVAPGPPTGLIPNGTIHDRAQAIDISWAFNDLGDVQSERTWEWGTNGTSFPNVSTLATSATTISVPGTPVFSHGNIYHRVKVEDNAGNASAYSSVSSFYAGNRPPAPTVTSSASPSVARPHITIAAQDHTHYRYRFERNGIEVFDSEMIPSSANSWQTLYSLSNGVPIVLFVSVRNDGLDSAETSQTVTPSYPTPNAPVVTVTPSSAGTYHQVSWANSDSPSYNNIRRYKAGQTSNQAIKVAEGLPNNGTFLDYNVASGVEYYYIVEAVDAVNDTLKESNPSGPHGITLSNATLHVVTKDSLTSNASGAVVLLNNQDDPGLESLQAHDGKALHCEGKEAAVICIGEVTSRAIRSTCVETSESLLNNLKSLYRANVILCWRDQLGNIMFCKLVRLPRRSFVNMNQIEVEVFKTRYSEAVV